MLDRRQFLHSAALATGFFVTRSTTAFSTDGGDPRLLARAELLAAIGPEAVREIGWQYRAHFRTEDDVRVLYAHLSARPAAEAIGDDFATGRTVVADGWVLSATEARQCALFSLLSA